MTVADFGVRCPTEIRFGIGRAGELASLLPQSPADVAFVQGGAGVAAAPVLAALREAGHRLQLVRCPGEPTIDSVNAALRDVSACDHVIACGGGSVIDTGKALAALLEHRCDLPEDFAALPPLTGRRRIRLIALPTTAGTGAEVTGNAVVDIPAKGAKISLRGPALYPDLALVDPLLARGAPRAVVLHAGLDALTQVIECMTSRFATPFSDALCRTAIPTALAALPEVHDTDQFEAWSDMCWVSTASGLALGNAGLGVAHGLASVLGAQFGAPHGALCGRLLLPTLRQNRRNAAVDSDISRRIAWCIDRIADAFPPGRGDDDLSGLEAWVAERGLPRLAAYGMDASDIDRLAALGQDASSSQKNAVPPTREDLAAILQQAL